MPKTREDNEVIDSRSAIYTENDLELLWPIRLSAVFDEN